MKANTHRGERERAPPSILLRVHVCARAERNREKGRASSRLLCAHTHTNTHTCVYMYVHVQRETERESLFYTSAVPI